MVVERGKITFFFFIIAFTYVLSPTISFFFFDDSMVKIEELSLFNVLAIPLLAVVFFSFQLLPKWIALPIADYSFSSFRILIVGILVLLLLFNSLNDLYGGVVGYLLSTTYIDRTGIEVSGIQAGFKLSLALIFSTVFCSLLTWDLIFNQKKKLISILFLLIFAGTFILMGSRNYLLWSFSPGLIFIVNKYSKRRILIVYIGIIVFSMLFAAYRNAEKGDILSTIVNLDINYFDPIIHEYGTSFRVFKWLIIEHASMPGYRFYTPYSTAFINLLPSILKPADFMTFSTALSYYNANAGEGLGNSPIAEYAYALYFPAVFIQVLPIFFIILLLRVNNLKKTNSMKVFALSFFSVLAFNFWRIGFAEIMKFIITFIFGYIVLFPLLKRSIFLKKLLLEFLSIRKNE
jgi:hypothetical protein